MPILEFSFGNNKIGSGKQMMNSKTKLKALIRTFSILSIELLVFGNEA